MLRIQEFKRCAYRDGGNSAHLVPRVARGPSAEGVRDQHHVAAELLRAHRALPAALRVVARAGFVFRGFF